MRQGQACLSAQSGDYGAFLLDPWEGADRGWCAENEAVSHDGEVWVCLLRRETHRHRRPAADARLRQHARCGRLAANGTVPGFGNQHFRQSLSAHDERSYVPRRTRRRTPRRGLRRSAARTRRTASSTARSSCSSCTARPSRRAPTTTGSPARRPARLDTAGRPTRSVGGAADHHGARGRGRRQLRGERRRGAAFCSPCWSRGRRTRLSGGSTRSEAPQAGGILDATVGDTILLWWPHSYNVYRSDGACPADLAAFQSAAGYRVAHTQATGTPDTYDVTPQGKGTFCFAATTHSQHYTHMHFTLRLGVRGDLLYYEAQPDGAWVQRVRTASSGPTAASATSWWKPTFAPEHALRRLARLLFRGGHPRGAHQPAAQAAVAVSSPAAASTSAAAAAVATRAASPAAPAPSAAAVA